MNPALQTQAQPQPQPPSYDPNYHPNHINSSSSPSANPNPNPNPNPQHNIISPTSTLETPNEKTIYNPQAPSQGQVQNQSQNRYEGQHPAPLITLQKESRLIHCPMCKGTEYTAVEYVSGGTTDMSALVCCLCFCLPCVPYLMTSFKDIHHKCGNCGCLLAIWKRSGKTEIPVPIKNAAAAGGDAPPGGLAQK